MRFQLDLRRTSALLSVNITDCRRYFNPWYFNPNRDATYDGTHGTTMVSRCLGSRDRVRTNLGRPLENSSITKVCCAAAAAEDASCDGRYCFLRDLFLAAHVTRPGGKGES